MDCKLDDVLDVKQIKLRKVQVRSTSNALGLRTLMPQPVDIPLVIINPVIREPKQPIYTSECFIINFED